MQWASASSRLDPAAESCAEVARGLRARLGDAPVDLMLAFVSGPGQARTEATAERLRAGLPATTFAAISARGVVTRDEELEQGVPLSVVAARLPGVDVKPFLLMQETWAEPVGSEAEFDLRAPGARGGGAGGPRGDPPRLDGRERAGGRFPHPAPRRAARGRRRLAGLRAVRSAARRDPRRGQSHPDARRPARRGTDRAGAARHARVRAPPPEPGPLRGQARPRRSERARRLPDPKPARRRPGPRRARGGRRDRPAREDPAAQIGRAHVWTPVT